MIDEQSGSGPDGPSFRTTLIRVLVVQVVALTLLAILQLRYPG